MNSGPYSPVAGAKPLVLLTALLLALQAVATVNGQDDATDLPLGGELLNVIAEGSVDAFEIQRLATPMFGRLGPPIIENSAESYRLTFLTVDLEGEPARIEAQLFVPEVADAGSLPLYVFGSGTTGIADACAPTRESIYPHPLGHARAYGLAYAGRGFVTIIPDYLGFENPAKLQSYFNAEAEARVMLDAARAVEQFFARQGTPRTEQATFLGGYSQGGHAAFAAADIQRFYAPEIELTGLLGFGATTDVEALLREGPYYAPYIALSYAQDYGPDLFDPARILGPRWLLDLEEAAGALCVDRAQQYYPFDGRLLYAPSFHAALYSGRLAQEFPSIARILSSNSTGLSGHGLPALIVQGESDVIVHTPTQTAFVQALCNLGSDVLYLRYPTIRHRETRPAGFEESIAWMRSLVSAQSAASTCPLLQGEPLLAPGTP